VSEFADQLPRLFGAPGCARPAVDEILARAAAVHERLLRAAAASNVDDSPSAAEIAELIRAPRVLANPEQWLCDPLLVAGLHQLARAVPALRGWHRGVASPNLADVARQEDAPPGARLGHVLLALRLRANPAWCGEARLTTDPFGQIEFPGSDWTLSLHLARDGPRTVLADHAVLCAADGHAVRWFAAGSAAPVLRLSREACLRMVVGDDDDGLQVDPSALRGDEISARLCRKVPLPGTSVRYAPVSFDDFERHSPVTGGLIAAVFDAIGAASPPLHEELRRYLRTIRGFELPASAAGVIQSFSDPAQPGVMSLNVPFTARHEPQLCPLCFTWFAHELAHTKSYLLETIAQGAGTQFLANGRSLTPYVPRYRRPLRLRTLLQIPYTHLYEWRVLADFLAQGFHSLPWPVTVDPIAAGDDLEREIEEAFALIERCAVLSSDGAALVAHLHRLHDEARDHWNRAVRAAAGVAVRTKPAAWN